MVLRRRSRKLPPPYHVRRSRVNKAMTCLCACGVSNDGLVDVMPARFLCFCTLPVIPRPVHIHAYIHKWLPLTFVQHPQQRSVSASTESSLLSPWPWKMKDKHLLILFPYGSLRPRVTIRLVCQGQEELLPIHSCKMRREVTF